MKKETFEELMNKLDSQILRLEVSHPVKGSMENPHSIGLILTGDTQVENLTKDEQQLAHTLLHMFHSKGGGRGLSRKTIERLHKDLIPLLNEHKKFDKLDL